jgi:hypothetical protein
MVRLGCALLLASLLPARPAADVLHVPGDYLNPQAAIDAAMPGDVVVIHGGTWTTLRLDKPLTLIGDPAPVLLPQQKGFLLVSPLVLAGSGRGEVVVANIEFGGAAVDDSVTYLEPAISGDGFRELYVYDSKVVAPVWMPWVPSGIAYGESGIRTSVPFVLVERSLVQASKSNSDTTPVTFDFDGVPAIDAPGTVVVLDSTILGGDAGEYCMIPGPGCGSCCSGSYGQGGPGIVCSELFHSGSEILGGKGATWFGASGFSSCAVVCSVSDSGLPFGVGSEVSLPSDLAASGPFQLGEPLTLTWSTTGPSQLFFSFGAEPPLPVPGLGWIFLDVKKTVPLGVLPATTGASSVAIPAEPALAGIPAAFQLFDFEGILGRPVSGVLMP